MVSIMDGSIFRRIHPFLSAHAATQLNYYITLLHLKHQHQWMVVKSVISRRGSAEGNDHNKVNG
jgi:hypothetical protein